MNPSTKAVLDLAEQLGTLLDDVPLPTWAAEVEEERALTAAGGNPLVLRQLADTETLLTALIAYRLTSRPVVARLQADLADRRREDL